MKIKKALHILKLLAKARVQHINKHRILLSFKDIKGFYLPYSGKFKIDHRQLFMVSRNLTSWLLDKYTHPDTPILPSDIVIDCGAFVGGFSIAAAQAGAKHVYGAEPSSINMESFRANICHYACEDLITPLHIGLGNTEGTMTLNLSSSGCDNSFLEPDEGATGTFEYVQIQTLKTLIKEKNIDPDYLYLKVEAEGFEPEVIYGLGEYQPRVIVIDITPERNNLSPKDEIEQHLIARGYTTHSTKRCLFAIKNQAN